MLTTLLTGVLIGLLTIMVLRPLTASLHTAVASDEEGHFPVRHLPLTQLGSLTAGEDVAEILREFCAKIARTVQYHSTPFNRRKADRKMTGGGNFYR